MRYPRCQAEGGGSVCRRSRWRSGLTLLLLACLSLISLSSTSAETPRTLEYRVKAAFLYNFTRFVEWPDVNTDDGNDELLLCVLGDDPFGPALEALDGKVTKDQVLAVRRFRSADELQACRVLFLSRSEQSRSEEIIQELTHLPVLTVSETDQFTLQGGIIRFLLVENKVRFEINLEAAERAGLVVSSKLLKLAHGVLEETP